MSTPAGMQTYIDAFTTAIAAEDWSAARKALVSAEICLQTLPNTQHASWRGSLDRCWEMLKDLQDQESGATGTLIHAAFRRKTRSMRDDGT